MKLLLDRLKDPGAVGAKVIGDLEAEGKEIFPADAVMVARFLLHSGLYSQLISFSLRHIESPGFASLWPYLLEGLALSMPHLEGEIIRCLEIGLLQTDGFLHGAKSSSMGDRIPALNAERGDRRYRALREIRREKDLLLERLGTLRQQQLYEQEKNILERLQKKYPGDHDVERETRAHRERYALEVLEKHRRGVTERQYEPPPEENSQEAQDALSQSLIESAHRDPQWAVDFAVTAAMSDLWETSLEILEMAPDDANVRWLRMECMLAARRYLEVMGELNHVEQQEAHDPETFFATAYLRAQALWGLGQKHTAIEVLESLLAARPQYRSGASLLSLWRGP